MTGKERERGAEIPLPPSRGKGRGWGVQRHERPAGHPLSRPLPARGRGHLRKTVIAPRLTRRVGVGLVSTLSLGDFCHVRRLGQRACADERSIERAHNRRNRSASGLARRPGRAASQFATRPGSRPVREPGDAGIAGVGANIGEARFTGRYLGGCSLIPSPYDRIFR